MSKHAMTYPITLTPTHLTYRLRGSIPYAKLRKLDLKLHLEKNRLKDVFPVTRRKNEETFRLRYLRELAEINLEYYLAYDRLLDNIHNGSNWLAAPEAKNIIIDSWKFIAEQYGLHLYAICVMSNHVHVLCGMKKSGTSLDTEILLRHHRHYTAVKLNQLQQAPGRRVWSPSVYDRSVRAGTFGRVLWYILNNPVKAGLTDRPLEWAGNWYDPVVYEDYILPRVQRAG